MFASSISRVRLVAAVAITAVMALSMALFTAAPAHAAGENWRNIAAHRCLDGSISQGVRLIECNLRLYQKWTIFPSGDGWELSNEENGLCLDGSISEGVRLMECNGSEYQQWEWRKGSLGDAFLNVATNKCLDGSISEGVRLKTCNNSDYQRWVRS